MDNHTQMDKEIIMWHIHWWENNQNSQYFLSAETTFKCTNTSEQKTGQSKAFSSSYFGQKLLSTSPLSALNKHVFTLVAAEEWLLPAILPHVCHLKCALYWMGRRGVGNHILCLHDLWQKLTSVSQLFYIQQVLSQINGAVTETGGQKYHQSSHMTDCLCPTRMYRLSEYVQQNTLPNLMQESLKSQPRPTGRLTYKWNYSKESCPSFSICLCQWCAVRGVWTRR